MQIYYILPEICSRRQQTIFLPAPAMCLSMSSELQFFFSEVLRKIYAPYWQRARGILICVNGSSE